MMDYDKCDSDNICEIAKNTAEANQQKAALVPECDGTVTSQQVDKIVAAYLMNQDHYSMQRVYDVVNASITGTITATITGGSNLSIATSSLATANDLTLAYVIDWGTGSTDVITASSVAAYTFTNQPPTTGNTRYEVKIYAITRSGNIVLLFGIEFTWDGTNLSQTTTNPITVNRPYPVKLGEALQGYCGGTPQGTPKTVAGANYAVLGALSLVEPIIRNEIFPNADFTTSSSGTTPVVATVVETLSSGTGAIPAGLRAVRIKRLTGIVSIGVYTLDAGNPTIDLSATEYDGINNYRLPAITPSGGTWQWIALV